MVQEVSQDVVTEPGTVVFPNLFEARKVKVNGQPTGDPLFGCELLFTEKPDIQNISKAVKQLADQRFPNRDFKTLQLPIQNGDQKAAKQEEKGREAEFYKGTWVLKTTSKYKPDVVDSKLESIIDQKAIYSGMKARVHVLLKSYDLGQNAGITAYLLNFMKVDDGEKLVGGLSAKQAFSDFATTGQTTNEDPTAGDDDLPWEG